MQYIQICHKKGVYIICRLVYNGYFRSYNLKAKIQGLRGLDQIFQQINKIKYMADKLYSHRNG